MATRKIAFGSLVIFISIFGVANFAGAAVTVTPASGGTNISADKAANATSPAYTTLGNIVIAEGSNGDIPKNQTNNTLILTAPSGWAFSAGVGSVSFVASKDITAATISVTASTATVTFTTDNNANKADTITISGLQVRSTNGSVLPSAGNILRTVGNPGTGTITGITNGTTNFGSLSQVVGAKNKLAFTTQPSASPAISTDFAVKPVVALQDQFGNTVTTDSASTITRTAVLSTQSCGGTAGSGTLTSTPASGVAVTSGLMTYTAMQYSVGEDIKICATSTGVTSALSNTVSVQKITTTTTLTTSGSPAVYGNTVTFTATVTPASGGAPSGTVTFKDGATTIGTGTLNGANPGVTTLATTTLSVSGSPHSITAVYNGDTTRSTSTSSAVSQTTTVKNLTITGITASNKVYNRTTTATLVGTPGTLVGVVAGDSVSLTGTAAGNFSDKNVGTGKTVTVSGQSLTGAQASNYSLTEPTTTANITSLALTVTGITASNKAYDRTTSAVLNVASAALSGVVSGDTVTLNTGSAVGTFSDKNVGTAKTVTVSGLTISGADSANYTLTQPTTTANITALALTVTGITASNKAYDGNTNATLVGTPGTLVGVISGDTVSLAGTAVGTFDTPDIGTGKTVTISGQTLTGADATNYSLIEPTTTADITSNTTTTTLSSSANPSVYGSSVTFTATVTPAAGSAPSGTITFKDGATTMGTGTLNGANPGVATFAISTLSVSASPHSITATYNGDTSHSGSTSSAVSQAITAKSLTITGITASDKTYDRTTSATLVGTPGTLVGVVSGDTVSLTGTAVGTFSDKNVGTAKTVAVSGQSLTGASAANYSLTEPSTTANITTAALTISGITAANKTYDGNTNATLVGTPGTLVGVISGDTVSLAGTAVGTFDTPDIGTGKTVTISGQTLTGADATNYSLIEPTTTADITSNTTTTTLSSSANPSVYGSSVTFTATVTPAAGSAPSGTITFKDGATTMGTGTLNGANPGVATYATTTLSVSGSPHSITAVYNGDSGHSSSTSSAVSQTITTKSLTVTGITAADKVYDGNTIATLIGTPGTLVGIVSGDTVSLTGAAVGTFASANVGTGILVTVSGQSLTGANASNYSLTEPTTTASITNPTPTTTSISPTSKTVGDAEFTLTINGTNLVSSSIVNFNGSARATTFVSSTQLTATILSSDLTTATSSASITVTNPTPGGGDSNAQTFTINAVANPVPVLTSISPYSATVGDSGFTMTLGGSNFFASSTVQFAGAVRTTIFASSTQLSAQILTSDLATVGTFDITVFNPTPGGGTSSPQTFTVNNPVPTITSISPTSTTTGTSAFTLTVNGTNFVASSTVKFADSSRATTFASSTQLTATILAADVATSSVFDVTVTNPTPGGGTSSAAIFTATTSVRADVTAPTVTAFTIPSTSSSLTVSVTTFIASDDVGVTGYLLTESSSTPSASNSGWASSAPTSHVFGTQGSKTLYAWAKDATNNISTGVSASVTITFVEVVPDQMQTLITGGTMVPNATATSSDQVTFSQEVHVTFTGGTTVIIPNSAVLNTVSAADWTTLVATTTVSTSDMSASFTPVGTVAWGLPSASMTLTQAATIQIAVGSTYNGETFTVFKKESGGTAWTQITTCVVSAGTCQFTTTTFSSFVAARSVTSTPAASTPTSNAVSVIKPTHVQFSGKVFPNGKVHAFFKSRVSEFYRALPDADYTISKDGSFTASYIGLFGGDYLFGLQAEDKDGRKTGIRSYPINLITQDELVSQDILLPPTSGLRRVSLRKGDFLTTEGYAVVGNKIEYELDGQPYNTDVQANSTGYYKSLINTDQLSYGNHYIRARQRNGDVVSSFSVTRSFLISKTFFPVTDLNNDGIMDINDWSIFLSKWGSKDPAERAQVDFNGDGKTDVADFSLLLRALKK